MTRAPLRKQVIGALRVTGLSPREIADQLETTVGNVYKTLHALRMTDPSYGVSVMDEPTVRAMAAAGATQRAIGEHFGVSPVAVHYFMKRRGIAPANPKRKGGAVSSAAPSASATPQLITPDTEALMHRQVPSHVAPE